MKNESFIKYLKNNGSGLVARVKRLEKITEELRDFIVQRKYPDYESREELKEEMQRKAETLSQQIQTEILNAYVEWCISKLSE